jgi:hypothetical protein
VPLGLLVTEFIAKYFVISSDKNISAVYLKIELSKDYKKSCINFNIVDNIEQDVCVLLFPQNKTQEETIADVLISALLEQLEAEITCGFELNNKVAITFKDL